MKWKPTFTQRFLCECLEQLYSNLKQTKCSSAGEWIHQGWYIHTMEHNSAVKGKSYWYVQQHGWISDALRYVREAGLKRLYVAWVHLHGVWKRQSYGNGETARGLGDGRAWLQKGNYREYFFCSCCLSWM